MFAALRGRRVIDLTRVLAGPFCTQLLSDWGADVVKIERPSDKDDRREKLSDYFHSVNRNKQSLAVNLQAPEGRRIVEELVATSDVFIENYTPGKLGEYGLTYKDLKSINPKLVYISMAGCGQTGPLVGRTAYDAISGSYGGLFKSTGRPAPLVIPATDIFAGVLTSNAIVAGILNVEKSGKGVWIQSSLELPLEDLLNDTRFTDKTVRFANRDVLISILSG